MCISFNNLTPESKIWIYQCNRLLKVEEQEFITNKMLDFVNNWQAHGTDLKASFEIRYNHFLVIGVDEKDQNATGCSIDASVHTLQSIQQELDVDLFDRMSITFKKEDNKVVCRTRKEFKELIARGEVDETTIVFNNMVTTKKAFDAEWEVPASKSWHARMFMQNA